MAALRAILFPLRDDKPRGDNWKVCWKKHAEGKLVVRVFLRDQFFGFHQFGTFTVLVPVHPGFEFIIGMNGDLHGAMASANDIGLNLYRAGSESIRTPNITQGG